MCTMPDNDSKPAPESTTSSNPVVDPPSKTQAPQASSSSNDDTDNEQQQDKDDVDELVAGVQALHVVPPPPDDAHPQLLRIARLIEDGKCKKIVCMCGAGISVSAGIPDFRTPGTLPGFTTLVQTFYFFIQFTMMVVRHWSVQPA